MMTAEKNIVVTGASSGLGLAASLLLGEQGARVGMILPRFCAGTIHA
jgi:NAD(P)-dependent dehydrogenase (short-subunit alcohol dehydrogenase family)